MFNRIDINIDSVEFEYITKGNLESINIARPDGVSYSQWSGVWEGFKEFSESRLPTLYDYVERQVDTTELEELEDRIEELKDDAKNLQSEVDSLENEIAKLEDTVDELKEENRVLQHDLEAAEKENEKFEAKIDDIYRQQAYGE